MVGFKGRRSEKGFDAPAKSHAGFEPDRKISRIRLSDKTSRLHPRRAQAGLLRFRQQYGCISMKSERQYLNPPTKPNKQPKLSRTHAPADLSPLEWQRGLRRQFGREQAFGFENLGSEPFFSEFRVSNPASKSSYRVAILGLGPGGNFCSCPDYATSELGTCKHVEFTLAHLEKKRGAKEAFARW